MNLTKSKYSYSQSFAVSNNCLDTCPKCGQNICEHTSVADAINLPNSISQDFSTYSSDSSLIKQLCSESSHSTTAAQQFTNSNKHINFSRLSINTLNNYKNSKYNNEPTFYLNQQKQLIKSYKNDSETRPVSCQVLSIDNETTDKLLRDFFDVTTASNKDVTDKSETLKANTTLKNENQWQSDHSTMEANIDSLTKLSKIANEKTKNQKKKKTKFSNFRLFLKSSHKSESKSSQHKAMRSRGLVNCLTSSASSSASSCEELRQHKKLLNRLKKEKIEINSNTENEQTTNEEHDLSKENWELNSTLKSLEKDDRVESLTEFKIKLNSRKSANIDENKSHLKIEYTKSDLSITSKASNYLCEVDSYNELHNLELCPTGDEQDMNSKRSEAPSGHKKENCESTKSSDNCNCKKESFINNNINSNNFNNNNIVTNHNNTTNINNISSFISVPLNSYLFYNYERKGDESKNETSQREESEHSKAENLVKNQTVLKTSSSKIRSRPKSTSSNDTENTACDKTPIRTLDLKKMAPIEKMSNIIPSLDCQENPPLLRTPENYNSQYTTNTKNAYANKNQLSFYTSCSSLDQSLTLTTSTSTQKNHNMPKYHSISIIFILIGLFSINFLQEIFMLFYYFSTEQTYWFITSIILIFCGQFFTLVITILADIDLINLTPPVPSFSLLSSVSSNFGNISPSSTTYLSKDKLYEKSKTKSQTEQTKEQNIQLINNKAYDEAAYNKHHDIYLIFQNPFSKLFLLLIPGYLPLSVYIKFFKHVFMYRKSSGQERFKLEFQLALHLFFNAIFYSLPLVLINACYLASTTTSRSLNWYYTEFYSFFLLAISYFKPNSSMVFKETSMERRNQLVLLLVSVFISLSIGVCLFTTYYELMKQINYLSVLTFKPIFSYENKPLKNKKKEESFESSKIMNLGLVEILVYFCYKFCLITSRVAAISLFWYSFHEWIVVAIVAHILILYIITLLTMNLNELSTPDNKHHEIFLHKKKESGSKIEKCTKNGFEVIVNSSSEISSNSDTVVTAIQKTNFPKSSRLKQHLILFITCLLSFVDLFMNQLSEIFYMKKIICYYVLYLVQNVAILTYWLVKTIMKTQASDNKYTSPETNEPSHKYFLMIKSLENDSSDSGSFLTPITCYAILIYLCIILFTIFGLVLKFLHLHILRKRYRQIYN